MATVWIERPIHPQGHAILAHHQVHCPAPEIGNPAADLSGVDAMIITGSTPIDAAFIARAPNLRVVARPGIGIDTINLADCTTAGVLVTNTPDAPSESTAEHAVTLLMAVARKLVSADQGMRTLGWRSRDGLQGIEMRGKTL
ncbi:MAG: hydroxyacid dehydrogenase, partial [Anaerolineae bacterium]|nr:hydroxyacid dehydrogenase [Anaerolineae bacterium]